MPRKQVVPFIIAMLSSIVAFPCTTFFIHKNGEMVFGRNYDWVSGAGMVCTNLRGLSKTSMAKPQEPTISWTSKYGSVTFNQYGKEFPTGGMNEKGLVVELMWLDETQYPDPDKRPPLNVLQWVQYQLDNHHSVAEVIASDKKLRIGTENPPLHYLVADAQGNAATIEFIDGKTVVHQGSDLPYPVLTNSTYKSSAKTAKAAGVENRKSNHPFTNNSLQRFTKACSMVQQYNRAPVAKPAADFAFNILDAVAQGDFTVWSIVYDLRNKEILFKTADNKARKSVRFNALNFDCSSASLALDMNQSPPGDVSALMKPINALKNRRIIAQAAQESGNRVRITKEMIDRNVEYAGAIGCTEREEKVKVKSEK